MLELDHNDADKISITIGNMDADFPSSTHIIAKIDHDSDDQTDDVAPEIDTATKAQLTIAELDTAIQTVSTKEETWELCQTD